MMIENEYHFVQNYPLLNMYLAFLIVIDFLVFPYTSYYILASWNNIKSSLLLHRQT